jgi:hypothetical protein
MGHLYIMRLDVVIVEVIVTYLKMFEVMRSKKKHNFLSGSGQSDCYQCGASGMKTCHVCNGCCHIKWYLQVICSL